MPLLGQLRTRPRRPGITAAPHNRHFGERLGGGLTSWIGSHKESSCAWTETASAGSVRSRCRASERAPIN